MFDFEKGSRALSVIGLCGNLRFDATAARCRSCHKPLEVHYCECRVYAVRCNSCEIIAIVMASNPQKAAELVGYIPNGTEGEADHAE